MTGLRRVNHTKSDPRTRRGLAILAQEAGLIFGDGVDNSGTIDGITGGTTITIALASPSGLTKAGGLAIELATPAHGQHMTVDSGGLSIDDDYVFNTGDSMTGALDITDTSTQITLKYDGSNSALFAVGIGGDLTITASGGDISFGNENLLTTGTLGAGVATLATGSTIGNVTIANGSITDSSGAISFGNESLTTTGAITGNSIITNMYVGTAIAPEMLRLSDIGAQINGSLIVTGEVTGSNLNLYEWNAAYTHSSDGSQAHSDYLKNNASDSTSGTLTSAGFTTTGDLTFELSQATWVWGQDSATTFVKFENMTSGANSIVRQYSKDGDGTEYCAWEYIGKGLSSGLTNYHLLLVGWNTSVYEIGVYASAAGEDKPIYVHTYGNTQIKLQVDGTTDIGDGGTTNYLEITAIGDVKFHGTAGFYPRTLSQAAVPAAGTGSTQVDTGEMVMWIDTDDSNKLRLVANRAGTIYGVELVAL